MIGYLIVFGIAGVSLVLDLTFGLLALMLIGCWKVSQGNADSDATRIFKLQLFLASQYIFTHMDDLMVEIWRFQDFPD